MNTQTPVTPPPGFLVSPTSPTPDDGSKTGKERQSFLEKELLWEKEMKDFTPNRKYSKVECLLLYYMKEREGDGFLDVEPEVEELAQVFKQQYGYGVTVAQLNEPGKSSATATLRYQLSKLVYEHDATGSLLIVYYAGHGYKAEHTREADLLLCSNTPDETAENLKRRMGEAAWKTAEEILKDLNADILLLFDCCFAGMLCGPTERGLPSKRHFDFLGACAASEVTQGPGAKSFTRAMIESMRILAHEEAGFPISVLQNQIVNYKDFPKHKQTPSHASRTNAPYNMRLSPLQKFDPATPPPDADIAEGHLDYCVTLDFLFDRDPDDAQFKEFCTVFKHNFAHGQAVYKKIAWRGMHRRTVRQEALARHFVEKWKRRASKSTAKKRKLSQEHDDIPGLTKLVT